MRKLMVWFYQWMADINFWLWLETKNYKFFDNYFQWIELKHKIM